jgi:lipoprotein NlpI
MSDTVNPLNAWESIVQGDLELAYRSLTLGITREPQRAMFFTNRGICLLAMHRLEDALHDFQQVSELRADSEAGFTMAGVTLWWLQRPREAVSFWRNALTAKYTDAAGGVVVPALLYFAALRLADTALASEARTWLRKRWKPQLLRTWPGPVAGYLLNKVDEETFLINQTFLQPILEARRLCQAHFWVAARHYEHNNSHTYIQYLHQAVRDESSPEGQSVLLEAEYWLAKAELELGRGVE